MNTTSVLRLTSLPLLLLAVLLVAGCKKADDPTTTGQEQQPVAEEEQRIISLNAAVTEIIHALGAADRLVGVDVSSLWPPELSELPRVGYYRQLSAEGILSLRPTLVIGESGAGPAEVVQQLRDAGVNLVLIEPTFTESSVEEKIRAVGELLQLQEQAEALAATTRTAMQSALEAGRRTEGAPSILFIYARGPGNLMVSGTGTPADAVIRFAGGRNAITAWEQFRPLSPEALVGAAPEWVMIPSRGLESMGGVDGLLRIPGLAETPAGRERRVLAVDDLRLLGFGPRQPSAIEEIAAQLQAGRPNDAPSPEHVEGAAPAEAAAPEEAAAPAQDAPTEDAAE